MAVDVAEELERLSRQRRDARRQPGQAAADARRSAVMDARKLVQASNSQAAAEGWLAITLRSADDESRLFAANVLDGVLPKRLLGAMIAAAVREPDPSTNRWFVQPAVRCGGPKQVAEAFVRIFREGTTDERIGALAALYWARGWRTSSG